ncbi:MAG: c-type cytochrome [Minicystis sp.]
MFFRSDVGCADCHSGRHFTNNQNFDVGTGHKIQVPTLLGVASRAPFMHDGCAATMHNRFDPAKAACNGGDLHGKTSHLSASDIDDLVAYLETL